MKKTELKKILKPLIQECVREAIFEEGVLSGIISEVARGLRSPAVPPPTTTPPGDSLISRLQRNAFDHEETSNLQEHKKNLMTAIGREAYNGVNLFEGTTPTPAQGSPRQMASSLHGQEARDAGVDISNLFGSVGTHWGAHMDATKERK